MRLTFISDTHNQAHKLHIPECDFLIHTGDFTMNGTEREVLGFLNWLGNGHEEPIPARHIVFIAGNHDFFCERQKPRFRELLKTLPENCHYLYRESIIIDSLKFYGSPLQKDLKGWAFYNEQDSVWDHIPDDTNILLTHVPPYGLGDQVNHLFDGEVDYNVGSKPLRSRVEGLSIDLHAFGHIHEGYGQYKYSNNKTIAVNAASLDENYRKLNKPIVVDL
jgi:hypothetical protein